MSPKTAQADQRKALGDFLRAKRQHLNPEDFGMPGGGRRRTPGLRREEVAVLANVGVSWYTRLEQGRDISPSENVITAIAEALNFNVFEREYLAQLTSRQDSIPAIVDCHREKNVQRILHNMRDLPAVCLDRYMNVFATNLLAHSLFGCEMGRNALETFFESDTRPSKYFDYANTAEMLVSQFRRNAARSPGDPRFASLAATVGASSPLFARLWESHVVGTKMAFRLRFTDSTHGTVDFESTTLSVTGQDDMSVLVYLPQGDASAEERWDSIRRAILAESTMRLAG